MNELGIYRGTIIEWICSARAHCMVVSYPNAVTPFVITQREWDDARREAVLETNPSKCVSGTNFAVLSISPIPPGPCRGGMVEVHSTWDDRPSANVIAAKMTRDVPERRFSVVSCAPETGA